MVAGAAVNRRWWRRGLLCGAGKQRVLRVMLFLLVLYSRAHVLCGFLLEVVFINRTMVTVGGQFRDEDVRG